MNKMQFIFLALAVVLFAAAARLINVATTPASLYWDEAAILADVRSISLTGSDLHGEAVFKPIYYSYGDYKMPVIIILSSLFSKITGVNELAVRLPNIMAGILTLLVLPYLGTSLLLKEEEAGKKRFFMLLTMLISSITPWHFHFSRVGYEAFIGQFFVAASVAVLFSAFRNRYALAIAPILGALGVYSYFSVRFVWPVVFIAAVAVKFIPKLTRKNIVAAVLSAVTGLAIFAAVLTPLFLSAQYEASNQFRYSTDSLLFNDEFVLKSNQYREIAGDIYLDRAIFHREVLRGRQLLIHAAEHLDPAYLFLHGDANLRHGTGEHGLLLISFAPFLLAGLFFLAKNNKAAGILLIVWWLTALLPASVPHEVPHALRSLNALAPLLLITAYGGFMILDYLKIKLSKKVFIAAAAMIAFTAIMEFAAFYYHYLGTYQYLSAPDWQSGHKEALGALYSIKDGSDAYVFSVDDRLYLWFLAYGPYSATDFQNWKGTLKEEISFDNIAFGNKPDLAEIEGRSVLLTNIIYQDKLVVEAKDAGKTIISEQTVYDSLGIPKYLLLAIE